MSKVVKSMMNFIQLSILRVQIVIEHTLIFILQVTLSLKLVYLITLIIDIFTSS